MADTGFDTGRKFVRVMETHANGLVEFEFAVGEPDMAVELIMPRAAFDEFCATNHVTFLAAPDTQDNPCAWTLHHATRDRFR
jgi:phenol hydroxylase P0 protein